MALFEAHPLTSSTLLQYITYLVAYPTTRPSFDLPPLASLFTTAARPVTLPLRYQTINRPTPRSLHCFESDIDPERYLMPSNSHFPPTLLHPPPSYSTVRQLLHFPCAHLSPRILSIPDQEDGQPTVLRRRKGMLMGWRSSYYKRCGEVASITPGASSPNLCAYKSNMSSSIALCPRRSHQDQFDSLGKTIRISQ